MPNTAEEVVDLFVECWNITDDERRRSQLRRVFTEDAVMIGGHDTFAGVEAIADFIERGQALAPVRATRTSTVDAHGGWLRYQWRAFDGEQAIEGLDVAELAEDG